jgi:ribosomal protein L21
VYAIIQARGRQLKVTPGAIIEVDGTPGEIGSEFSFDQVLLVEKDAGEILAGAPFVANAKVVGVVDGEASSTARRVDPSCACSRRSAARDSARPVDTAASSLACALPTSRYNQDTPWLIKKVRAALETAATATRSGSA